MGAVKSITHSYAANEYLFWHIEKKDLPKICQSLEKRPDLINKSLTVNFKTTPLHRAAVNGSVQICQLLVQKYNALVDFKTENGETPLMGAAKRDMSQTVKYLLKAKADADIISNCGLKAIEYAILQGFYETALIIYQNMKEKDLKSDKQYEDLGKKFLYRYVNYQVFCENLKKKILPENVPDFLTKTKRIYEDPVVDPRQTWKTWFLRNLQFQDPPICERSQLPDDLQPQNRRFGKINYFFSKMAMTHLTQKPSFMPRTQSQVDTLDKLNAKAPNFKGEQIGQDIEMKTVS